MNMQAEKNIDRRAEAFSRSPAQGEARWWFGGLAVIKATAADTGGQLTLVEVTENEGEAPLHVHHREDEAFWILDGEVEFRIGDTTVEAGPGSFVFGPRGVPHSYVVRRGPARMLFLFTPGGFENLLRATSVPAAENRIPIGEEGMPDMEALPELARRYGCELLG
jgi:mannose-6-phosphate isomerase-like protein (cupin superfamily)